MAVKCVGSVVEPKCSFKGGNLDFKDIAICKPETRQFSIKNNTRAPAIYCVEESTIPEFVEVTPSKGKIGPDDSKDINVKIFCKDVRTIKGEITILVRGSKTMKIPVTAQIIVPDVEIEED